jgi:long-chain fatty acid transport protein
MATSVYLRSALILAATSAVAFPAMAGGLSRGSADTSLLYEADAFTARTSATYVMPQRGFATINGVAATDDDFTDNFFIPSIGFKARITNNLNCAFTYTQPFGANISYGPDAIAADNAGNNHPVPGPGPGMGHDPNNHSTDVIAHEYGATCAVNFDLGQGKLHLIGGGFIQSLKYVEQVGAILPNGVGGFLSAYDGTLTLEDSSALGYRLGAAYEIQEYALRVEALYRSEVEHSAKGTLFIDLPLGGGLPGPTTMAAQGGGKMPQSFEVNLQTGVAPGWLALGSVKWTDWSVLPSFNYTYDATGLGGSATTEGGKVFNWRDGWTIMGGVGHAFSDDVSGAMTLTWDRGVGTGANLIMTDTWTLGAAAQIKAGPGVARIGGAVSYLTSGSQSTAKEADFDATADGDWAYALNASYKIAF